MALPLPHSPRADLISPRSRLQPVPALFAPGEFDNEEEGGWFFNMKVHHDIDHPLSPISRKVNKPHLEPVKYSKTPRGHGKTSRDHTKASRGQSKPALGCRHRKLASLPSPSPAELREQIDIQTARSIGDSLIFHNIPERCDDTPEGEVVKFCQDYLVGRRIKHVKFGQVHKMEPRFSKDAPIAARFSLSLPGQTAPSGEEEEGEKYQPIPYIPPLTRRRLPILNVKNRKKLQFHLDT